MPATEQNVTSFHPIERYLAMFGAVACVVVSIGIWVSVSANQGTWPLPALYFVELMLLSVISAAGFVRSHPAARFMMWATVGVLGAFCILGAFSVGLAYVPITLIFAAASVTSDVRNKQPITIGLAVCLLAAIAQAALMLAAIRLLF